MTATTDYRALLAAIRDNPDEDTPRLMLADYLDENDIDPARAELIRVQCELTRLVDQTRFGIGVVQYAAYDGPRVEHLLARESALIAENGARWRKGPVCGRCDGRGWWGADGKRKSLCEPQPCCGTGDTGGLWRRHDKLNHPDAREYPFRLHVHFRRGFIERVDVPALEELLRDGNPQGSFAITEGEVSPSPWLRAVLTATPERALIREVVPLDFDRYLEERPGAWYWRDSNQYDGPTIPAAFCPTDQYPTREEAIAVFGRAVVTWARKALA